MGTLLQVARSRFRKTLLAASLLGSAAIGFGYALGFALPALRSELAAGEQVLFAAAHLTAAVLFAALQLRAALHVIGDRRAFLAWLVPGALYLFSIGIAAWLGRGELEPLALDSVRGLWLLGLGALHARALQQSPAHAR